MSYVAVVDDEADIREILEIQLSRSRFDVKTFENGDVFLKSLSGAVPDIVLLDIMMDNMNGYEVLSALKRKYPDVAVVFLTAKSQTLDKVLGLDLGADDYITKPFQREELIARLKALLRRQKKEETDKGKSSPTKEYRYRGLVFSPAEKSLTVNGNPVKITKTEYLLLKLLTSSPRKIFTRDEILESVWEESVVSERTIDVHIRRLRKKLDEYADIIKTHSGFGYSIESPKE
jgi:DNA-binding response OmpR family regulator